MVSENQKDEALLHECLNKLEGEGRIPVRNSGECIQMRWQWNEYPSGVHFAAPTDPDDMGRYNDPTSQTGICYTADYAAAAIAESLGRVYQRNPEQFILGMSDLQKAHMYTLTTTRDTRTIDMSRLQGMLHITADQTMGNDYSITQAITNWAANTPGLDYDGISYRSRHFDAGMCTAFWVREGMSSPLADVARQSVDSYVDTNLENFPQGWQESDISGFDIVVETLQFSVSADDSK